MEVKYSLDEDRIESIVKMNSKLYVEDRAVKRKITMIRLVVGIIILIFAGIIINNYIRYKSLTNGFLSILMIILFLTNVFLFINIGRDFRNTHEERTRNNLNKNFKNQEILWRIEKNNLVRIEANNKKKIKFTDIIDIYEREDFLFIESLPKTTRYMIPLDEFENEVEKDKFKNLLEEKIK